MLGRAGYIGADERTAASLAVLACTLATTLTSFLPLVKSTMRDPSTERVGPWLVWTVAYLLLVVTTVFHQTVAVTGALLLYPVLNLVLHGTMAYLSFPKVGARHV